MGLLKRKNSSKGPTSDVGSAALELERDQAVVAAAEYCASANYGRAIATIDVALADAPSHTKLRIARGTTLLAWGRYREAYETLKAVESIVDPAPSFHEKLGLAAFWIGELTDAERCMRIALEHKPNDWERHFGLGMVLQAQQNHGDAAAVFERALSLNPDDRHCLANLLSSELELEHIGVAERLAQRAVKTHQDSVVAWSNLGVVMDRLDRYDEALAAFEHADSVSSKTGEPNAAFVNHAICLLRAGRTSEAIELFEARLPTAPSIQGHCHYSLALLLSGRMREGWDQYEFRWLDGPLKKSRATVLAPAWGGQGIGGKTILVRSEQGFGDFFQFIRYAPYLKSMGARVLLQLHEALRETAKWIEGIDHVLAVGEPYGTLDYYTNLLSLPRVFGTELHNIPADIPYIRVDPSRSVQWKGRLTQDGSLKVGLAWAGSPTHLRDKFRSINLAEFEPLARIPRIKFYSLQKGPAAAAARTQTSLDITDFESDLNDFADTAALINELDLVICVDTSVAHLAGALGKPVWLMVSSPGDWRWQERGDHSPWYPTCSIFRQTCAGKWSTVVQSIEKALRDVCAGKRSFHDAAPPLSTDFSPLSSRCAASRTVSASTHARVGFIQYLPNQETVGDSLRTYGEYLQHQLDILSQIVPPSSTVVEVGPGVGVHAIYLANLIGKSGHLILYESRSLFEQLLRQNLATNGIGHITIMRNRALGALAEHSEKGNQSYEALDELGLSELSLLKLNEYCDALSVIDGSTETIWRLRPLLFTATSDDAEFSAIRRRIKDLGYRTWRIEKTLFNPQNFNCRADDIFRGRTSLSLLGVPEEIRLEFALAGAIEIHDRALN